MEALWGPALLSATGTVRLDDLRLPNRLDRSGQISWEEEPLKPFLSILSQESGIVRRKQLLSSEERR